MAAKDYYVWYAEHPRFGDLVLLVEPTVKRPIGLIYCARMVRERLKHTLNDAITLEIQLGPVGLVPKHYYEEAGIQVNVPLRIRKLLQLIELDPVAELDRELEAWILTQWDAQVT